MSDKLFKIKLEHMHPFEASMYINAYESLPMFKKLNLTPNNITTISVFCGILSLYNLWNGNALLAILFSYISFYYDCADGLYARKYNMITEFGDYYDHITDIIQYGLYIGILFYKYNLLNHKLLLSIMIIQLILVSLYMGCVEKIYTKKSDTTLSLLRNMCIYNVDKNVKILKYFSSVNNLFVLFIVTYHLLNKT